MSAAAIPLCFKLNQTHHFPNRPQQHLHFPLTNSPLLGPSNFICFALSNGNSSNENPFNSGPQEEARWLREEQRWLREEQRWLRQESRWNEEKEELFREIQRLKMRIQDLEHLNSVQGSVSPELTVNNIAKLLQLLKEGEMGKIMNRIPEIGSSALPFVVETAKEEEEVVVKDVLEVPEKLERKVKERATLRTGSEGEEVRMLQAELQKLGFYSGEEDIEFSAFSSGTERAVKTWQSSLGAPEDGIMTPELLAFLYEEQNHGGLDFPEKKKINGAVVGSVTDVSEVQKTVITEDTKSEEDVTEHRVYLLGENRWEEPSRISGRNKQPGSKISSERTTTRCVSCHGEGKMLCTECEGTGEPNIEPQFLEWVGEGALCAYCDGLGFVTCDVSDGRKVTNA